MTTTHDILHRMADVRDVLDYYVYVRDALANVPDDIRERLNVALAELVVNAADAERAAALRAHADAIAAPDLPEGWEWVSVPLFVAYAANREAGVWIGLGPDGDLHINGGFGHTINHADAAAVRAVLARAGVAP